MKRKYIILGLIVLFVIIQFIPVDRTNPNSNMAMMIKAPDEVMHILEKSCFDCHSNLTEWPFYSYVAPVSWLVASDVAEGREHMNFSAWQSMPVQKQNRQKSEIVEHVMDDEMPLPIYLIMHSDAKLTDEQKQILKGWVEAAVDTVGADE
jgi:hypothetical protein